MLTTPVQSGTPDSRDGTITFFRRVNDLLEPSMTVLDLGAGRGRMSDQGPSLKRDLAVLKGKVAKVIGVDVDPVVLENVMVDEAYHYDGRRIPLDDLSVDLVVSDHTLEHIADPAAFAAEVGRVLKPGGWFCARTPHLWSVMVMGSKLVPNRLHARVLRHAQPDRQACDVFPTVYKLNTRSAVARHFPGWTDASFTHDPEPAYTFGSRILRGLMETVQAIKRPVLGGDVLMVFLRKSS